MLRNKPSFRYNGLTIFLSNPSRFDKEIIVNGQQKGTLISGTANYFFEKECLAPHTNRHCCDIRLIDSLPEGLLPGTKCILLLGQRAHTLYTKLDTTIDEHRGNPIIVDGLPCISTFSIQDCMDIVNYEKQYNEALNRGEDEDDVEFEGDGADVFVAAKGKQKTSRANYRFWVKKDIKKLLTILENNGQIPRLYEDKPVYHIYPDSNTIINLLCNTKGQDLFFDIETDFQSIDMRCFAFSFSGDPFNIYIVPTLTTDYKPAYDKLPQIMRALAIAIRDNTLVAHNGSNFDFFVLAYLYNIAIGDSVYDTMIAQHRILPEIEKSLGHCVSLYTYEPYHKNEGNHVYLNSKQAEELYLYCGKDVFTMYLVKKGQDALAAKDSGLQSSISWAMRSIKPYLTMSLLGIHFSEEERQAWIKESDAMMTQMLRLMRILCGPNVKPLISNQKCAEYFHEQMGYPVVMRSKKTNKPGLGKDNLLKLKLRVDNPVLDILIKYRKMQKETSTLQFKTWLEKPLTTVENK